MRRYIEYGITTAAILTFIYIIAAYFTGVTINIKSIFMCIGGGIITGAVVSFLLLLFSPGVAILEGEEDNYIS